MKTFVFSKDPQGDVEVLVDLTFDLKYGEVVQNIVLEATTPITDPQLTTSQVTAVDDPMVKILLTGGYENVQYGFKVVMTTNAKVSSYLVATTVQGPDFIPYTTSDPNSYVDLVDTIQAGQSAIGTAVFMFPAEIDPSGGYVTWEFMDAEGTVYSQGNAFDYQIQASGLANTVLARSVINCPSSVPESTINSKYQLRYTLKLKSLDPTNQQTYYSTENVTVVGLTTTPLGTQDQIELVGKPAKLSIVLDKLYDNVMVEVFANNASIGSAPVTQYERVGSGYYYAASIDTTVMQPSLENYDVVWSYSNNSDPSSIFSESARLWISTPSILTAVNDLKSRVNKAHTTLYGTSDLIFPSEVVMVWLRRGMDMFNGYQGLFTTFTMTNAKGGVREYWLMCSEVGALLSQELAEAEKQFDFQGAAISLSVDHAAAYGALADKIQSRLDSDLKPTKQNLIIKGNTGGDGSADTSRLVPGAIGAVGITITPASPWGVGPGLGFPYPRVGVFL